MFRYNVRGENIEVTEAIRDYVEKKVGKLTYVSWRNKFTGWHDSWAMSIDGDKHGNPVDWHDGYNMLMKGKKGFLNSRLSQGDMFYHLFLRNVK